VVPVLVLPVELAPPEVPLLVLEAPVAVPELDDASPVDPVEVLEPPATLKQPPHPSVAKSAAILREPIGAHVFSTVPGIVRACVRAFR